MKDTKRQLISEIDPVLVATIKEIVKNDMRKEIEAMKSSDDGCSQKCKLINEMMTKDVNRNRNVVNEVIQFKWCETCQAGKQPGAVNGICQSSCGQKFYNKCIPLMTSYGEMEKEIQRLRDKIAEITARSLKFQDYMKAKQSLEMGEIKLMSKTYSGSGYNSPPIFETRESMMTED